MKAILRDQSLLPLSLLLQRGDRLCNEDALDSWIPQSPSGSFLADYGLMKLQEDGIWIVPEDQFYWPTQHGNYETAQTAKQAGLQNVKIIVAADDTHVDAINVVDPLTNTRLYISEALPRAGNPKPTLGLAACFVIQTISKPRIADGIISPFDVEYRSQGACLRVHDSGVGSDGRSFCKTSYDYPVEVSTRPIVHPRKGAQSHKEASCPRMEIDTDIMIMYGSSSLLHKSFMSSHRSYCR
jgi:hypothetical protein